MVKYGMTPLAVLRADLLNGARLLGWEGAIGGGANFRSARRRDSLPPHRRVTTTSR
jgi:hypothetical protein